jgi:hypothetical protein
MQGSLHHLSSAASFHHNQLHMILHSLQASFACDVLHIELLSHDALPLYSMFRSAGFANHPARAFDSDRPTILQP